jgi:hypothetical protein
MYRSCNPTPKPGERNVFCPYYNQCLDRAVEEAWKTWHCSRCSHKVKVAGLQMLEGVGLTGSASPSFTVPLAIDRMLQAGYL